MLLADASDDDDLSFFDEDVVEDEAELAKREAAIARKEAKLSEIKAENAKLAAELRRLIEEGRRLDEEGRRLDEEIALIVKYGDAAETVFRVGDRVWSGDRYIFSDEEKKKYYEAKEFIQNNHDAFAQLYEKEHQGFLLLAKILFLQIFSDVESHF